MEYKLIDNNYNWQKICTVEDYFQPDFQYVLKEVLQNLPSFHRKQWEFVVIYINLLKFGKLKIDSVGASFGAGREPLIYIIAEKVKSFLATDLYKYNTGWKTAQLKEGTTCLDFVLESAPKGFDHNKLSVVEMDMRELNIDDNSLDFCYSSCAFEHIGHKRDFVNHLKEVKRALKEDGIYVLTTEHLFMHDTIKVKGNYKFDLTYLFELFELAEFYPDGVFDNQLPLSHMNKPRPELDALNNIDYEMLNLFPGLVLSKRGVPYTSSCFVLRKSNAKLPDITNKENVVREKKFINTQINKTIEVIFNKYRELDCFYNLKSKTKTMLYDHIEYLVDNQEEHFESMPVKKGHFAFTEFIYFNEHEFEFLIEVELFNSQKLKYKLVEIDQVDPSNRNVLKTEVLSCNLKNKIKFTHKGQSNKAYAVAIFMMDNKPVPLVNLLIKSKIIK